MPSNILSNRRLDPRTFSISESLSQLAPLDIALYRATGVSLWQWQRLYRPMVKNTRSLLVPAAPAGWRNFVHPLLNALTACRGQARSDSLAADAGERWIYALTVAIIVRRLWQEQGSCRLRGPGGELWGVFCGAPSRLGLKKARVLDKEERHWPEEAFILLPYLVPACGLSWLLEEHSVWRALLSFVSGRGGALSGYASFAMAASAGPDSEKPQPSNRNSPTPCGALAVAEPAENEIRRHGRAMAWEPGHIEKAPRFGQRAPSRRAPDVVEF